MFGVGCASLNSDISSVANLSADRTIPISPILYIEDDSLWMADAVGNDAVNISQSSDDHFAPVWFPNEVEVAYGVVIDDYYELWNQDIQTGSSEFLVGTKELPHDLQVSPNNQYLMYFEADNLYMLDIEQKTRTRLYEGAISADWSPDGKQIVYLTSDNRLLLQDFKLDEDLSEPLLLLEQEVVSPIFIDTDLIAYETDWDGEYTVLALDLRSFEAEPITSLRFSSLQPSSKLRLEPNGSRLMYIRQDDVTELPNAWVFHMESDAPKLILTNVYNAIWSAEENMIFYLDSTLINKDEIQTMIYSATDNGLSKTEIITGAHSVVTPGANDSNEYKLDS